MKHIFTLIATCLLTSLAAQNPSYTWGKQLGSTSASLPNSIAIDSNGNVYSTGIFQGTTDFDPSAGVFNLTSNGSADVFISKFDPNGNLLWAKSIGGSTFDSGKGIAVDASGNAYITGYFSDVTVDFDPGAGTFNMNNSGGQDIYILKLDINGNFVWAKQFSNANCCEEANAITLDGSNNIYITGSFSGTMDFDPNVGVFNLSPTGTALFISKLDVNGNFVLARQCFGNSGVQGMAIKLDGTGNIYTTGVFSGTDDFDPGAGVSNLTSFGGNDVFVLKLDATANFVFAKQIGGTGNEDGWAIEVDNASNIIIGGDFQSTADFDPGVGTFTITSAGSYDAFVCKLNSSGNFVWAKAFGGTDTEKLFSLQTDVLSNIYSVGQFKFTVDFDPALAVYNLTATSGNDGFIHKLDPAGNFMWAGQIGGTASEVIQACRMDLNNNLYFGGQFNGTTDLDAGAGSSTLTATNTDGFFCKYSACTIPAQPVTISGLTTMCSGAGSTTYSIASVFGATSYSWSLPGGWSGTSTTNTISATPGSSGIISVTASNTCGTSSAQNLTVTINALPTIVYAQNPDTVCANVGIVALGSVTPTGGTFSGTAVSGTNFNATTAGPGTFTITYTYTDGNSCTNTASQSILVDLCTGLSNQTLAESDFIVFPNPATELVTITTNENKGQLIIYNTLGAVLYSQQLNAAQTSVDVSAYQCGIYFIQIQTVNGMATKKIIKQ